MALETKCHFGLSNTENCPRLSKQPVAQTAAAQHLHNSDVVFLQSIECLHGAVVRRQGLGEIGLTLIRDRFHLQVEKSKSTDETSNVKEIGL